MGWLAGCFSCAEQRVEMWQEEEGSLSSWTLFSEGGGGRRWVQVESDKGCCGAELHPTHGVHWL